MNDRAKAREEAKLRQQAITEGWKEVASKYPLLIEDFNQYVDGLRQLYMGFAEDQEMHGVPLDDHQVTSFLQQRRTCDIVRTYITSRIDLNVAQPIKKSK